MSVSFIDVSSSCRDNQIKSWSEELALSEPAMRSTTAAEGSVVATKAQPAKACGSLPFCYVMYTSGSTGRPLGVCGTEEGARLFDKAFSCFAA